MEVTVEVDPDGKVAITISDESGYSPDVADDFLRRCRETATTVHLQLHGPSTS